MHLKTEMKLIKTTQTNVRTNQPNHQKLINQSVDYQLARAGPNTVYPSSTINCKTLIMHEIPYEERPYRPCVGIFLINCSKQVFGGRIDSHAKAWQMPQGGIDPGETVIDACMREMAEEIGTSSAELLCEHTEWRYYDIPLPLADKLWHGQYKGQKQKWIALRFTGNDADININTDNPEFCEWRWLPPADLVNLAVPFKRDLYGDVLKAFKGFV